MTETEIANLALGKVGGAGDQVSGAGQIASIDGTDRVSVWCKTLFPRARRRVISDLASLGAPFKETLMYKDLGAENASPPEIGGWDYAFNLPSNVLRVVKQIDEEFITTQSSITDKPKEYRFDVIFKGTTKILITNDLTNAAGTSAFVQYAFDQKVTGTFSEVLINCIATLLGSELVPVVGAVEEKRQTLLAEYKTVTIPDARKYNLAQDNRYTRTIATYKGGRSETLSTP